MGQFCEVSDSVGNVDGAKPRTSWLLTLLLVSVDARLPPARSCACLAKVRTLLVLPSSSACFPSTTETGVESRMVLACRALPAD